MKEKAPIVLLLFLTALGFSGTVRGQSAEEFQVKAVFIYNFTQFVQWPAESFATPEDPFIIGVVGENVFGKYLEEAVAGEHYHSRPIVVQYYNSLREAGKCHILYVGRTQRAKLNIEGPVLTIGESGDFMDQKGLLRFYKEGGKVRIEINQAAATGAGLTISSKLLRLATIHQEK